MPNSIDLDDLDVDYEFIGGSIPGTLNQQLTEYASTVETSITMRGDIRGVGVALTFGAMYITDMPRIVHNVRTPTSLDTTDAATVTAMFEILL